MFLDVFPQKVKEQQLPKYRRICFAQRSYQYFRCVYIFSLFDWKHFILVKSMLYFNIKFMEMTLIDHDDKYM